MKLDEVTAVIRPRSQWESIDLGCALARRSYLKLLLVWLLGVIPIWIGIAYLMSLWAKEENAPFFTILICWILLGFFDRVLLYVFSRDLFGEHVTVWQTLKQLPKLYFHHIWRGFWGRFSLYRGLSLPIVELERVKGKAYKSRMRILIAQNGGGIVNIGFITLLLQVVLLTTLALVFSLVYSFYGDSSDLQQILSNRTFTWETALLYGLCVSLLEPFFVGACFAVYINARTLTEGWDIELAFKRLNARLEQNQEVQSGIQVVPLKSLQEQDGERGSTKKIKSSIAKTHKLISLLLISLCFLSSTLQNSAASAKQRAEEISKQKDFIIKQREHKVYDEPSWLENFFNWLGSLFSGRTSKPSSGSSFDFYSFFSILFHVMLWLLAAAFIWFLWTLYKRHYTPNGETKKRQPRPTAKTVMGMNITSQSLPDNILQTAKDLWNEGKHHEAISLLYRGSISWLVNNDDVPIEESDTEYDCLRRVKRHSASHQNYFRELTNQWVKIAYGKKDVSEDSFNRLCTQWNFHTDASLTQGGDNA